MEQKQIGASWTEFFRRILHIVECIGLLLKECGVLTINSLYDASTWRWLFVLTFLSRVIVIIFEISHGVSYHMIGIRNRVGKRVHIFLVLSMFFAHHWIIFFLFESHLYWNSAAMQVGLSIQIFYGKQSTLLALIVNKSPILIFL